MPVKFKQYEKTEIKFINIKAEKVKKGFPPLFDFIDKTNLSSQDVGKEYFKIQGYNAKFSENDLWKSLFHQLIYKNLIKLHDQGKISTINERKFDDEFYRENEYEINNLLSSLREIDLEEYIKNNYRNSSKRPNAKRQNHREKVLTVARLLENDQILIVMEYLVKDFIHNRRGFPDLMVWNDNEIFFAEIKANSDVLSYRQVNAHKILQEAGIGIVLLTINKSKNAIKRQKKTYTKKRISSTSYKERYELKLDTANKKFEILNESNSKEIMDRFNRQFKDKDFDYFIAFLNVLNNEEIDNLENLTQDISNKVLKEEKLIRHLSIMAKARSLEDKGMYREAVDEYSKSADDKSNHYRLEAYHRMCITYRKLKDLDKEFATIKKVLEDDSIPNGKKLKFKNRIKRKLKKKDYIKTDIVCPNCNDYYLKYKIHNGTGIKMYSCKNCKFVKIEDSYK